MFIAFKTNKPPKPSNATKSSACIFEVCRMPCNNSIKIYSAKCRPHQTYTRQNLLVPTKTTTAWSLNIVEDIVEISSAYVLFFEHKASLRNRYTYTIIKQSFISHLLSSTLLGCLCFWFRFNTLWDYAGKVEDLGIIGGLSKESWPWFGSCFFHMNGSTFLVLIICI